jgi:iron complex transport system ATP-binding protein
MLNIKDISFSANGTAVLDAISFSVSEGETVALIGPSGSGKSALLSSIAGILPSSGKATTDGASAVYSPRRNILLFPAKNDIRDEESIYQTVLSGRASLKHLMAPYSPFDMQTADEILRDFGIDDVSKSALSSLPDSVYKMVLLAHHAAYGAPVFLLDNPDEALDIASRMRLIRALRKYVFDGKHSVLFATNDLNFASQCADRFIVMHRGRIAEQGGHEIFTEEMLRNIFGCEGIVSKNIYNGRAEIQFIPET